MYLLISFLFAKPCFCFLYRIKGFGSVGAIIEGPFIAFILLHCGWSGAFYVMVLLTLLSAVAIGKPAFGKI